MKELFSTNLLEVFDINEIKVIAENMPADRRELTIDPYFNYYVKDGITYIFVGDEDMKTTIVNLMLGIEYVLDSVLYSKGIWMKYADDRAMSEVRSYIRSGIMKRFLASQEYSINKCNMSMQVDLFKVPTLRIWTKDIPEEHKAKLANKLAKKNVNGIHLRGEVVINEDLATEEFISTIYHEVGHWMDHQFAEFFNQTLLGYEKTSMKLPILRKVVDSYVLP